MISCSRSVAAETLARNSPAAARCRSSRSARDLQGGGAQRDQAEVVTERVVHLPGDPGPLPQSDPLGGTPLLAGQRVDVPATGVGQLLLLAAVPADQPGEHGGEEQHRGEQEPGGRAGAEQPQVERRATGRDQHEDHDRRTHGGAAPPGEIAEDRNGEHEVAIDHRPEQRQHQGDQRLTSTRRHRHTEQQQLADQQRQRVPRIGRAGLGVADRGGHHRPEQHVQQQATPPVQPAGGGESRIRTAVRLPTPDLRGHRRKSGVQPLSSAQTRQSSSTPCRAGVSQPGADRRNTPGSIAPGAVRQRAEQVRHQVGEVASSAPAPARPARRRSPHRPAPPDGPTPPGSARCG